MAPIINEKNNNISRPNKDEDERNMLEDSIRIHGVTKINKLKSVKDKQSLY